MSSKRPSLINFRKQSADVSAKSETEWDSFVANGPDAPAPDPKPPKPASDQWRQVSATYKIPMKVHKALKVKAAQLDQNVSELVTVLLADYLDRHVPDWRD